MPPAGRLGALPAFAIGELAVLLGTQARFRQDDMSVYEGALLVKPHRKIQKRNTCGRPLAPRRGSSSGCASIVCQHRDTRRGDQKSNKMNLTYAQRRQARRRGPHCHRGALFTICQLEGTQKMRPGKSLTCGPPPLVPRRGSRHHRGAPAARARPQWCSASSSPPAGPTALPPSPGTHPPPAPPTM